MNSTQDKATSYTKKEERSSDLKVLLYTYLMVIVPVSIAAIIVAWPNEGVEISRFGSISLAVRQLILVVAGGLLGTSLAAMTDVLATLDNPRISQGRFSRLILDTFV